LVCLGRIDGESNVIVNDKEELLDAGGIERVEEWLERQ
jgi:hypothetical protein